MEASIVDLRYRMKEVLAALDRGEDVTVLYRGEERARLVPVRRKKRKRAPAKETPGYGMWKDRDDLADPASWVRTLRRGRFNAA
jgi:antitoxin (DNA-binding transcriptional repressor) of toxin-antitoxin stability system